MLRTRYRERSLIDACLQAKQPFVVENTNLTREERARYLAPARAAGFRLVGYRLWIDLETALARNVRRKRRRPVPDKAIRAAHRRWIPPDWDEGFDELFDVWSKDGGFRIQEVPNASS
jgi:predicted kinase